MTSRVVWLCAWCALAPSFTAQVSSGKPAETVTPGIPGVVAAGTQIHLIETWDPSHGGEGPVAAPEGGILFVQDAPNRVVRLDKDGHLSTFIEAGADRILGLAYDRTGRLIGTRRGANALVVLKPTPAVLADGFEGTPFGSPNDLVVDAKGGVYFTDPAPRPGQGQAPPPGSKSYVFYLTPAAKLIKVTEEVPRPNGIQLSPDGKTLYVVNVLGEGVMALDVQPDGGARNPRDFVKAKGADGLAVDSAGRLYAASDDGVAVFDARGQHLGTIPLPLKPRNLTFAGPDKTTLYVVSRGAVYTIATQAHGPKNRAK